MTHYRYQINDTLYDLAIERHTQEGKTLYQVTFDDQVYLFDILDSKSGEICLRFNGRPITLHWVEDGGRKWISREGCTYLVEPPSSKRARPTSGAPVEGKIRSPMPAQVQSIEHIEGDTVSKGDTLLLLEAMKMEIRVRAPVTGKVRKIFVHVGQAVDREQLLVEIDQQP